MRRFALDHWFIDKNELTIGLMNFYVSIKLEKDEAGNDAVKLYINDSEMRKEVLDFDTVEDAVAFTEIYPSKQFNLDQVLNSYWDLKQNRKGVSL